MVISVIPAPSDASDSGSSSAKDAKQDQAPLKPNGVSRTYNVCKFGSGIDLGGEMRS